MTVFFETLSGWRFKGDALLEINRGSAVSEFGRGSFRLGKRGSHVRLAVAKTTDRNLKRMGLIRGEADG
jgi:hypothetical protein